MGDTPDPDDIVQFVFPDLGGPRGITLHDYFAAAALPAIVAQHPDLRGPGSTSLVQHGKMADIAAVANEIADAMLAERKSRFWADEERRAKREQQEPEK